MVAGLADPLIRLVHGPAFGEAVRPLRLLACSIPFVCLGYVLVNVLVSSDQTKLAGLTTAAAAAINIVANLLLIPIFGIAGAAMAAIAGQVSLLVLGAVGVGWAVTGSRWVQLASKPVVAGAAMFVAVLLIWQMGWGIAFPAGFVVYLLTLALTGALREEELWR